MNITRTARTDAGVTTTVSVDTIDTQVRVDFSTWDPSDYATRTVTLWFVPADQAADESAYFTRGSLEAYAADGCAVRTDGTRYRLDGGAMGRPGEEAWDIFTETLEAAQVAALAEAGRVLGMHALAGDHFAD